jgi:hypothetical protein
MKVLQTAFLSISSLMAEELVLNNLFHCKDITTIKKMSSARKDQCVVILDDSNEKMYKLLRSKLPTNYNKNNVRDTVKMIENFKEETPKSTKRFFDDIFARHDRNPEVLQAFFKFLENRK